MVKQIAGRAGRRSSQYKGEGMATCLHAADMDYMHYAMAAPVVQVKQAGLFPAVEFLQEYSDILQQYPDDGEEEGGDVEKLSVDLDGDALVTASSSIEAKEAPHLMKQKKKGFRDVPIDMSHSEDVGAGKRFKNEKSKLKFYEIQKAEEEISNIRISEVLSRYMKSANVSPHGNYFLCSYDSVVKVSDHLYSVIGELPLTEAFPFCMAPVNTNDPLIASFLKQFAERWFVNKPNGLNLRSKNKTPPPSSLSLSTHSSSLDFYF